MATVADARWVEAAWKMRQRREADSNLFRFMLMVRDRYNAPSSFALPDVDGEPTVTAPVPMLLADAIDSHATRASSQEPNIICPALDRTKPTGKRSLEFADVRRNALQAAWFRDGMTDLVLPRALRHLSGYGTWNMIVTPDYDSECARVELRDPLTSYPETRTPEDTRAPIDCGYVFGKSTTWLMRHYRAEMSGWVQSVAAKQDDLWDVVEWVDPDYCMIGVLGPRKVTASGNVLYAGNQFDNVDAYEHGQLLRWWQNKAGMTPVGTPRRATLDLVFGQVARMVPIADLYGRLSALNYIAAEKEVFPAIALVGNQPGRVPTLEGGRWADGRSDDINTILDGDVKVVSAQPGAMTRAALADTERAIRQSAGLSGAQSGELNGSLRSGQTINSLSALAMDPQIMESHRLTQRALVNVNEAYLATEDGYWPRKKYTVFAGGTNDGLVDYTPEVHFEKTYINSVKYPMPGMDAGQINLALLQLSSSQMESKRAIRHKHPLIDDAERAHREILLEAAEDAIVGAFSQHIMDGTTPIKYSIEYYRMLQSGGQVIDAIEAADNAASAQQAQIAPPPGPGQAMSPEAAPGLQPALAAGQPAPTTPGPNPSQVNLKDLLMNLGRTEHYATQP